MTTTRELIRHYSSLLIIQYVGSEENRAAVETNVTPFVMPQASVQTLSFSATPTDGGFAIAYGEDVTSLIAFNATAEEIHDALSALPGLSDVTVSGSMGAGFTITFLGVTPLAQTIVIESNTLTSSDVPVIPTVAEVDLTIPLAVQDAFNLIAPNIAIGVQLDWVGKYVGVTRTALGLSSNITLDDADFIKLIKIGIIKNTGGSTMYDIVGLLQQFFPGEMLVFDNLDMTLTYYISTAIGSNDLLELFITQGLLPRPMAVLINVIIVGPVLTDFFGFRTYTTDPADNTPFNNYTDGFEPNWFWLSYANAYPT